MGQQRWAAWEIDILVGSYSSTKTEALMDRLPDRSPEEIERQAAKLHLAKNKGAVAGQKMPRWTPDEVAVLREAYPDHSNASVARVLGRSIKSVLSKAHSMGLRKTEDRLHEMGTHNVSQRKDRRAAPDNERAGE